MIKKRIITAALCLIMAAGLCGCGNSGDLQSYLEQHNIQLETSESDVPVSAGDTSPSDVSGSDVSGSDVSASDVTTTTTTTTTTAAPVIQTSAMPEKYIGGWEVISIYQEAQASDISAEEALRREQLTGISFGSSSFDRSGESIREAVFLVNENATYADMESFGISTKPLKGPYGADAKITSVEVRTADGMVCTTVFFINDTTLIAFGSGMNVFTYEQMAAVG